MTLPAKHQPSEAFIAARERLLARIPTGVPLAEVQRRQATFNTHCDALALLHLEQLTTQLHEVSRQEGLWQGWMSRLCIRVFRRDLARVAAGRAGQALHMWNWLEHEAPNLTPVARARKRAEEALRGAPLQEQVRFAPLLAQALLQVVQSPVPAGVPLTRN